MKTDILKKVWRTMKQNQRFYYIGDLFRSIINNLENFDKKYMSTKPLVSASVLFVITDTFLK